MKSVLAVFASLFLIAGTCFLVIAISAVMDRHFIPYAFDKAMLLYLFVGAAFIWADPRISRLGLLVTGVLILVSGIWVYYQMLIVGRSLSTFFFYEIEHAAVTWVLAAIIFYKIGKFKKGYWISFAGSTTLFILLWITGFTFGKFHESAICSTLVWAIGGITVLIYALRLLVQKTESPRT